MATLMQKSARSYSEVLELLWGTGTSSAHSDDQLLGRFLTARDQAGELAFELLVKRHGPMVERVCRRILDDPEHVHDAWQAVFLVLAKSAGAIRNRESLGSWLHGVAVRAARRTRANAIRQRVLERHTAAAAVRIVELAGTREVASARFERAQRTEALHQEIARLPEKYRTPIVLCYMEGLTHDEAAAALRWPVGTVRSRLARGRDTLRGRLCRRGLATPEAIGPIGAWLTGAKTGAPALAAALGEGSARAIPDHVAKLVAALACHAANGSIPVTETVSVTSVALSEGVLTMMTLKKLMVIAAVCLSLATLSAGGFALVKASKAQERKAVDRQSPPTKPATQVEKPAIATADEFADKKEEVVRLALERFELQVKRHIQGELSLTDVLEACDAVESAELWAANSARTVLKIKERALRRLEGIETGATELHKQGMLTESDLKAVKLRRVQAAVDLMTRRRSSSA